MKINLTMWCGVFVCNGRPSHLSSSSPANRSVQITIIEGDLRTFEPRGGVWGEMLESVSVSRNNALRDN